MKTLISIVIFMLICPIVASAHPLDFYSACKEANPICQMFMIGVRQGYARGLFEAKNELLCKESYDINKLQEEVMRIFKTNEYNPNDNEFFIVIDAINNICMRK